MHGSYAAPVDHGPEIHNVKIRIFSRLNSTPAVTDYRALRGTLIWTVKETSRFYLLLGEVLKLLKLRKLLYLSTRTSCKSHFAVYSCGWKKIKTISIISYWLLKLFQKLCHNTWHYLARWFEHPNSLTSWWDVRQPYWNDEFVMLHS